MTRTKEARGGKVVGTSRGTATPESPGIAGAPDPSPDGAPGEIHGALGVLESPPANERRARAVRKAFAPAAGPPRPPASPPRSELLPIARVRPSGTNPKSRSDEKAVAELTDSIRRHGVLQPILVRSVADDWVVICGHRRLAAAAAAGLEQIPATVHDITEVEALELQLIENVQRQDLHPLEEAEGYQRLVQAGYDVARIAERTGKSPSYVYDRMKLVSLSQRAKNLFLDGVLTPGHAILLARLKTTEQDRALKLGECVHREDLLWHPEGPGGEDLKEKAPESGTLLRAVSVRELRAWIDGNVRFDGREPDPMLFPETAETLGLASKVVAITYMTYVPDPAREGKTFCRLSWKRADGKERSKPCPRSVTGFVAIGPRRGEAFPVCVDKHHCEVHWAKQVKAKKLRAAERTAAAGESGQVQTVAEKKAAEKRPGWQIEQERENARRAAAEADWQRIARPVREAIFERIQKLPATAKSPLGQLLIKDAMRYAHRLPANTLPPGSTAEGLVRHLASILAARALDTYVAYESAPEFAKALGIDLKAIRKRVQAQAPKSAAKKPAAKRSKRGKRGGR